jgi:Clostripain family
VPKVAVLHFNNCFNMSVEVLHTVAPYVEYATGYINYNFFTAGDPYPEVFQKLAAPGSHTSLDVANWFADGNQKVLAAKGNHPTVGSVVHLAHMKEVSERIDDLADALLAAMRTPRPPQTRAEAIDEIKQAIVEARQLDTPNGGGFELETPDELTDIRSFAIELQKVSLPASVHTAAKALEQALVGFKRYGANDRPWVDVSVEWNFAPDDMAMNILLPDPLRRGLWDWRSPFYMNVNPDPNAPKVQPHIIDFLKVTDWVDFIDEYHKDVTFVGLLAAKIPEFPVFNAKFVPPPKPPCDPDKPPTYDKPGQAKGRKAA